MALSLRSSDRANDALVIIVVLAFEGAVELATISGGFWALNTSQKLLGVPLSTTFNVVGTVLPVLIYVYAILLPRFLKLTGSVAATIVLGGLGYALAYHAIAPHAYVDAPNLVRIFGIR